MTLPSYEELTAPAGDELPSYDELTQGVTATGAGIPTTSSGSTPDSAISPVPAPPSMDPPAAAPSIAGEAGAAFSGTLMSQLAGAGQVAGLTGLSEFLRSATPHPVGAETTGAGIARGVGTAGALLAEGMAVKNPMVPAIGAGLGAYESAYADALQTGAIPEHARQLAREAFLKTIPEMGALMLGLGGGMKGGEMIAKKLGGELVGKAIGRGVGAAAGGQAAQSATAAIEGESPVPTAESLASNILFGIAGAAHGVIADKAKLRVDKEMDDLLSKPVEDLLKPATETPDAERTSRQISETSEQAPQLEPTPEGRVRVRDAEQDRPAEAQRSQPAQETPNVTEPVTESPSPLAGPALKPTEGEPLRGQIGEEHGQMKIDAAKRGEDFTEAEHGFHDAEGNFLNRVEGAQRALDTGLIDQAEFDRMMARDEPGMTSQDLKRLTEAEAKAEEAPTVLTETRSSGSFESKRKVTQEGVDRVEAAKQSLRDVINNPDLVGGARADAIENGKNLISFLDSHADTRKPLNEGYEHGDRVAYTGEDAPEGFRSFIYLEGHKAGETGVARTPEARAADISASKTTFREQQEGFKRVRESGKSDQMPKSKAAEAPAAEAPKVPGAPPVEAEAAPVVEAPPAPGAKPVDTWTSATETPKAKPESMAPAPIVEPRKAQTPAEQIETIAAHQKETKAAERLANASDTSPAKLKVQKAYLLDALDKTLKEAPDRTAYRVEADTDAAILDNNRHFHSGDTKETFDARREAELTPLFEKYGIPERSEAETGYLNLEGGRTNEREGVELNMDARQALLREAVDAAIAEQQPKIEIEVPGDGTFRIVNTKDAIRAFQKTVAKGFPTAIAKGRDPKLNLAPPPTAIPPLGKPKTKEDMAKIAGVSASADETRYVLVSVMSDGKHLIATDGRRLIMLDEKAGGTEAKPIFFDPKTGKPKKIEGNYPNWKQVIPDKPKKEIAVETAPLLKLLIQAQKMTDEKSKSVKLWENKDGSIGVSSNTPDVGEFEGNVQPSAKTLAAFDPEYLIDALRGARQLGHDKVTLGLIDEMAPLTMTAPKMKAVVMPMRIMSDPFLLQTGLDVLRKLKAAETVKELRSVRKMTDLDKATGEHSRRMQTSFEEAHAAQREIRKAVPKESRRNAISVWIEANGDVPTLQGWEAVAKGRVFKKAAAEAQSLTPEEIAIANRVKSAFSVLEGRGRTHDVLSSHRDNYVPHIWDIEKRSALSGGGKLVDKFRFNKARTFNTFAEGDQAGFTPKSLDISNVLPAYLSEMNKVIAARQFVEDISAGAAKDSRPLVLPEGRLSKTVSPEGDLTYLVDPKARKNVEDAAGDKIDQSDYVRADQPALKEWNWEGKDNEGNPIFMKDNLLLHPEAAERLNAMIGRSKIKQWAERPTTALAAVPKAIVRALDTSQQVMKREMFGLISTFHQVQEGWHAIGHSVNPFFNIPKIDLRGDAGQRDAARHGLMLLPEKEAGSHYLEGVGGDRTLISRAIRKSGKPGRILADVLDGYQDFLFQRYIPGLKMKTYDAIVGRNTKRFQKELASGELTDADVKALSATQTNAAYGHLNYAMLDRSPTMQHLLSLSLLAPDFLEARTRFTGQAAKSLAGSKAGNEQFKAIAQLAMIQAGLAYTAAQLSGGKWDEKHPFEVQIKGRRYTLRSVPEDLFALVDEPRKFAFGRISPLIARGGLQAATGRNYRGEATSLKDTAEELLAGYIPIAARGVPGVKELTQTGRMADLNPLEQFASTMGLRTSRYSPIAETHKLAHEWMKKEGLPEDKGVYPISKYQPLRYALEDGDDVRVKEEYDKLLTQPGETRAKIHKGFKQSMSKPFTQSEAMDHKMKKSLKPEERALFEEAVQKRKVILSRFYKR